jgi:hypothetical protein
MATHSKNKNWSRYWKGYSQQPSYKNYKVVATYRIRDLFNGLNVVTGNELIIGVEELDATFLESSLGQEQAFDSRQTWSNNEVGEGQNNLATDAHLHSCGLSYACSMRASSSRCD